MQLIGFGIMICGTFTYYKVVRLPFCNYEPEEAKNEDIQRLKENDELLLAEENRRNNINNARRQERGGSNQFQIHLMYMCVFKSKIREKQDGREKKEGKKKKEL